MHSLCCQLVNDLEQCITSCGFCSSADEPSITGGRRGGRAGGGGRWSEEEWRPEEEEEEEEEQGEEFEEGDFGTSLVTQWSGF